MSRPAILWLTCDLRLSNNAALTAAAASGEVVATFILDDETPGPWKLGSASRWWLHHSLARLSRQVNLVLRRGRTETVLADLISETGAHAVYHTRNHAPWSRNLEQRVAGLCENSGMTHHRFGGYLLHEPETITTKQGGPYKVFTPFANACLAQPEPRLASTAVLQPWNQAVTSEALESWELLPKNPNWAEGFEGLWQPGEEGAQDALSNFIAGALHDYVEGRDEPAKAASSKLSPHLHWGEISPAHCFVATRAAAAAAGGRLDQAAEKFLKELLWRDFSYATLHHFPELPQAPFHPEFAHFPWLNDEASLRKWKRGETGYPIVDAGMRELWQTGTMHNRVRMIVASFLTKHLLVSWTEGERWFWDTLLDADIANNAFNWQWVAGSGADASPYFRIFNPVLQGEKFDTSGEYVRRWVPELSTVPLKFLHHPWDWPGKTSYPPPMVDHDLARQRALAAFAAVRNASA